MDRFNGIKTRADAQAYAQDVVAKAKTAQANRASKPPLPFRVGS